MIFTQKSFSLYFTHKITISQFSRICSHYDVIVTSYIFDGTYFGINRKKTLYTGSTLRVIRPFILIIQRGLKQAPTPFGKYVWEKCSEELGLRLLTKCFILVGTAMFGATFNLVTRVRLP